MSKELGELRPSQLLFYHGPGSIVDMLSGSVMVMAADMWKMPYAVIEDERLKRALGVGKLKLLNENQGKIEIKATRFPKWKVCPKCGMMTSFKNTECYHCKKEKNVAIELFPSRFIYACKNGHIQDFPWDTWVHQGKVCDNPLLKMTSKGLAGSLSDMSVRCVRCNAKRSLGNIMKDKIKCSRKRPWLGDYEKCRMDVEEQEQKQECEMEVVLRGAAKLYSPIVFSVLTIPLSEGLEDSLFERVIKNRDQLNSWKEISEEVGTDVYTSRAKKLLGVDDDKLLLIEQILNGTYKENPSFESIRKQEWNTLIQGDINDLHETGYKAVSLPVHPNMQQYFCSIMKVESLPEVQVLRGFTRLQYPDRFQTTELAVSPIMKDTKTDWLPAVKNLGEGIFFQFNLPQLQAWENREDVKREAAKIYERYNKRREQFGYVPIQLANRHLLIHTFSHALIQEFARFSGYSTTSLRERIYSSEDMYGVLIYTASSDSEGSLGGLVELSKPDKLQPILERALAKMEYCSSDPHCSDAEFDIQSTINGAACHACSFVSETSCEWGNELLDRRVLLPLDEEKNLAFFNI